jgi:hypothetical protein
MDFQDSRNGHLRASVVHRKRHRVNIVQSLKGGDVSHFAALRAVGLGS